MERIHPALAGLIELLPQDGDSFPPEKQRLWLETARGVLRLVYRESPAYERRIGAGEENERRITDDMHLAWVRGRFAWRWKRKSWWHWLMPHFVQDFICWAGNKVLCSLFGHDDVLVALAKAKHIPDEAAVCPACCKRLEVTP